MAKHKLKLMDGSLEHIFHFSHLMFEEYFTALRLGLHWSFKEIEAIVDDLKTHRYEMVTKLLFGLCNPITVEYLSELIPSEKVSRNSIYKNRTHFENHCEAKTPLEFEFQRSKNGLTD